MAEPGTTVTCTNCGRSYPSPFWLNAAGICETCIAARTGGVPPPDAGSSPAGPFEASTDVPADTPFKMLATAANLLPILAAVGAIFGAIVVLFLAVRGDFFTLLVAVITIVIQVVVLVGLGQAFTILLLLEARTRTTQPGAPAGRLP